MKKIKFLNGICSMTILAVVTSVSSLLFTSCEKEDFDATFTAGPATATINVNVIEFPSGAALPGVTITADKGDVSGMVVNLRAGADGTIPAQDVTISATAPAGYEPIQSVTVHVNALKAGGVGTYNATLVAVKTPDTPVIPDVPEQDTVVIRTTRTEGRILTSELLNATHTSGDGKTWWENAADYILITKVTYMLYNEQDAKVEGEMKDVNVDDFLEALNYNHTKETVLELKVSAWSIYRAWFEVQPVTTTYTFSYKNSGEILGKITAEAKNGTAAQYEEQAHPGHNGYQPGHGHGAHGSDDNAGGGIALPD